MLNPRPRDFTSGKFKVRTTETASIPTDEDVVRSVRQGLHGTAMPAWDKILSDAEIADVVAYVKTLSPRFAGEAPLPVTIGVPIAASPESAARGAKVYDKLHCASCHGVDGRGTNAVATAFKDEHEQTVAATDLTEPWTFHGGGTAQDIYLRFRTGMTGTPMPSFRGAASDNEMWDLANYVVSLARKPVWEMNADEVKAFYASLDAAEKANPAKRGEYLVNTIGCGLCHSPVDEHEQPLPGMRLAGGVRLRIEPFGEFVSYNLTSDKETGLGNWTDDQIKQVITRGVRPDGSRMLPYPMDWPSFSTLKPDDLNAMIAYLRTLPPVSNRVPKPKTPFLPVYLWGKFRMLILGEDLPMLFFPGNAGTKGGQS
jgi:cytochrome c oxidase cbb3-type subunit 2